METINNMGDVVSSYLTKMQNKFTKPEPKFVLSSIDRNDLQARLTASYMLAVESRDAVFANDAETEKNIQMVVQWIYDSKKRGLLLYGTTGNGKTTMLRAIKALFNDCTFAEAADIWEDSRQVRDDAEYRMRNYLNSPILIIDDLGAEPEVCKVYGENRYPLENVIVRRYTKMLTTIIASNLTLKEIEMRYGTRMFDRMMEMYDRIVYRGKSYRR